MIMATLNGNLGEGASVAEKVDIKQSDVENKLRALKGAIPSGVELTTIREVSEEEKAVGSDDANVHIFVKFNFMMNSFNIGLYTNDEDSDVSMNLIIILIEIEFAIFRGGCLISIRQ